MLNFMKLHKIDGDEEGSRIVLVEYIIFIFVIILFL